MSIQTNIQEVRQRIAAACGECGRDPKEITLVGASKMNDAAACREAIAAGIDVLGENRVQEMTEKLSQNAYDGVVLNLESTNKDVARRLIDFLSGVAYAGEGKIKKVAANTYIITPYHVELEGDLIDELENNGLYF